MDQFFCKTRIVSGAGAARELENMHISGCWWWQTLILRKMGKQIGSLLLQRPRQWRFLPM